MVGQQGNHLRVEAMCCEAWYEMKGVNPATCSRQQAALSGIHPAYCRVPGTCLACMRALCMHGRRDEPHHLTTLATPCMMQASNWQYTWRRHAVEAIVCKNILTILAYILVY